jgi:lysozyme family protein
MGPDDKWLNASSLILKVEGPMSNDKADPGGLTKYGISQAAYPSLNIAALTEAQALAIYKRDYWDAHRCGDLPWLLAVFTFDGEVNQGGYGSRALQQALGVTVDGAIGDGTVTAANACDVNETLALMMGCRAVYYAADANWRKYGKGWVARMGRVILGATKYV